MEQQGLWERAERLRSAADEAARLAQNIYLSFLLLGTYIAIIIGSTTDVQLLKVSPVTLPLLNVQLPIVGFYVVVPWLLLLIYFNLLLHLTFLAQRLHRLNAALAAFPDEAAREEQRLRLFPFPFSAVLIGRTARWRLRVLLGLMVWTTVVILPLLLLLWAQVRFLPYHDTAITWSHRAAVLVDLMLLWLFWPLMLMPGQSGASVAQTITLWLAEHRMARRTARTRYLQWGIGLLCVTLVTVVFSLGIAVLPEEAMEGWIASRVPPSWRHAGEGWIASRVPLPLRYADPSRAGKAVFKLTYWLFEAPGAPFHRNLRLQEQVLVTGEPSAEVLAALRSEDETKRAQALEKITGLTLTNRDLRGADLRDTLFAKVDLRGANLKGASFNDARVFAANFSDFRAIQTVRCVDEVQQSEDYKSCRTNLQGAALWSAQLQGANLRLAQLQGALLWYAQLQGANLQGAQLQGAAVGFAQLQGANLQGAQLQGAYLERAQLQGANLEGAQLQVTLLSGAQLQGATLQRTQFQGANLAGAQLQGATLGYAQLQGANLEDAQLQGADLSHTWIGSADFTLADLTLSSLQSLSWSPLDKETYKTLEQLITHTISSEPRRAYFLMKIKAAVGQPAQLKKARYPERILCDDVRLFPSCITEKFEEYDQARASLLGKLGCHNAVIARGMMTWHVMGDRITMASALAKSSSVTSDSLAKAFAKWVTAMQEKDCPGWTALPAELKDKLRTLAAEEPSAP